MSNSQDFVDDIQKKALETVNTSGYRYTPYEIPEEKLQRENRELCARVAELEKENENQSANLHMCHNEIDLFVTDLKAASARIAALEAAQQWHPASEPPPMTHKIHKTSDTVELLVESFYSHHYKQWGITYKKKYWRDLPPRREEAKGDQ